MKNNLLIAALSIFILASCTKKQEDLVVDLSKYNADTHVPGAIDNWIGTNLTDPYNIDVIYRFERNLTDVSKDISPVKLEMVIPTMESVLNIFLKPYEKVAGKTFIRTFTPKQFVLYGSTSYNTNGSVTLGTADGGRRVVLYDLNTLDVTNGENIRRRIRTIHHEFTHIINQNIEIPEYFEMESKEDYTVDWTGAGNTAALAKELGFISQYSRNSFGEDFAEMVAHLLVEGQVWFNNYINTTNLKAKTKLLNKEKIVKDYFKTFFNIDFGDLQAEVQRSLKEIYLVKDPKDLTKTLPIWLLGNKVNSITVNPDDPYNVAYGSSALFKVKYDELKNRMAVTPGFNLVLKKIEFLFTSDTTMVFRTFFTTGGATVYNGDFNFKYKVNPVSGDVVFTKVLPEGSGATYNNGALFKEAFESTILGFLTNNIFVASWLPSSIEENNPLYRTFGGFYVKTSPTNYFYGPIVLK